MTDLYRCRASWTGFSGAPGVTTMYGLVSGALVTTMHDLFVALGPYLPDSVTVQVEATGDVIDDATGALTGAWTDTPVLPVVGGSAAQYAAPQWLLHQLEHHHHPGRTPTPRTDVLRTIRERRVRQ